MVLAKISSIHYRCYSVLTNASNYSAELCKLWLIKCHLRGQIMTVIAHFLYGKNVLHVGGGIFSVRTFVQGII